MSKIIFQSADHTVLHGANDGFDPDFIRDFLYFKGVRLDEDGSALKDVRPRCVVKC